MSKLTVGQILRRRIDVRNGYLNPDGSLTLKGKKREKALNPPKPKKVVAKKVSNEDE